MIEQSLGSRCQVKCYLTIDMLSWGEVFSFYSQKYMRFARHLPVFPTGGANFPLATESSVISLPWLTDCTAETRGCNPSTNTTPWKTRQPALQDQGPAGRAGTGPGRARARSPAPGRQHDAQRETVPAVSTSADFRSVRSRGFPLEGYRGSDREEFSLSLLYVEKFLFFVFCI